MSRYVSPGAAFTKYVELDFGSPSIATKTTRAHGLGVVPKGFLLFAECTTASEGYAVGDIVQINPNVNSDASFQGCTTSIDATNVILRIEGPTADLAAASSNLAAPTPVRLTRGNWKIWARVWA